MHKRGATFRQLLRRGMIHQVLANDRFWRAQPRVLMPALRRDGRGSRGAVAQLARHIGLGITGRQAVAIAEEYSPESNLTRIHALRRQLVEAGIDLTAAGNLQIYDPVTLLHWNHFRPTGSGCWRTGLSRRECAMLARICSPWLEANGYDLEAEPGWDGGSALPGFDGIGLARERLDLAVGRAAALLRCAAGWCPPAAALLKQLLRIGQPALGSELAWSPSDAEPGAFEPHRHPGRRFTWPIATGCGDTPAGAAGRIRRPGRPA